MNLSADYWIESLELIAHPEGGYYKSTYQCPHKIIDEDLRDSRSVASGIYYLLKAGDFSAFHRLDADEMWHFYAGDDLNVYTIDNVTHELNCITIGNRNNNPTAVPQAVVPKNTWFAAEPAVNSKFTLVGATVFPAFLFDTFELATKEQLAQIYPQHEAIINRLTRA